MKTIVLYSDIKYKEHVLMTVNSFSRVNQKFNFLFFQIDFYEEITIDNVDIQCIHLPKVKGLPHMQLMKPMVLLEALKIVDDFIYVDCDTLVSSNFEYDILMEKVSSYPVGTVLHETFWQYPVFFWHTSNGIRMELNEDAMMKYLSVTDRTQKWVTTLIMAINRSCLDFIEEWNRICLDSKLWDDGDYLLDIGANHLEPYRLYFHMGDETPFNVLLWKNKISNYFINNIVIEPRKAETFLQVEYEKLYDVQIESDNQLTYVKDSNKIFLYHQLKDLEFKNLILDKFKTFDTLINRTENIKFGIYTSFYNSVDFIESCFKTIESINYQNFEWHIVDDFSDDLTKPLLLDRLNRSPISNKIKFYDQIEKKQMYWKPNDFFDDTFDWIVLIDSDDSVNPECLKVYNSVLSNVSDDLAIISSDFHKIDIINNSLHSISFIESVDPLSSKIKNYHPTCDYLNNISYYCFGHLRAFKNIKGLTFDIHNMNAAAEDSYRVLWSNSYGKYLNVPVPLYNWYIRSDSESHTNTINPQFNDNFESALGKLNDNDAGVSNYYSSIYNETCALSCLSSDDVKYKSLSLWTRKLQSSEIEKICSLYQNVDVRVADYNSEVHVICLNYFTDSELDVILKNIQTKNVILYYQNKNYHFSDDFKDAELKLKLNHYLNFLKTGTYNFYWWSYIRHFFIKKFM